MLKKIADPSYTTHELSAEMLELMTKTSFEDRLPKLLPKGTRVAHKIGAYESTFSDARIVFPEESGGTGQEYYIVAFSEGATQEEAREAIQDISLAAYQASLARMLPDPLCTWRIGEGLWPSLGRTVLRSRWCQSGVNRSIGASQSCSRGGALEVRPAPRRPRQHTANL